MRSTAKARQEELEALKEQLINNRLTLCDLRRLSARLEIQLRDSEADCHTVREQLRETVEALEKLEVNFVFEQMCCVVRVQGHKQPSDLGHFAHAVLVDVMHTVCSLCAPVY